MRSFYADVLLEGGDVLYVAASHDQEARRVSFSTSKWREVLFFTSAGARQLAELLDSACSCARLTGTLLDEHDVALTLATRDSPPRLRVGCDARSAVRVSISDVLALSKILRAAAAVVDEADARLPSVPGGSS